MGFKCPVCLEDFGINKEEWKKHIEDKHDKAGKDIVNFVMEKTKKKKDI